MIRGLRSKLRLVPSAARFAAWRLSGAPVRLPAQVAYVTDASDWVIRRIGLQLEARLTGFPFRLVPTPRFLHNSVVHFGSVHAFCNGGRELTHPSNRIVLTIYHGDFGIDSAFDRTIRTVIDNRSSVARFITSTSIMVERLISWGVDSDRISRIPIGIDLDAIKAVRGLGREELRAAHGIPPDAVCIGSFQKDGNGWGDGLEPKLVKGPDLFVEAVARIAKRRKVHCLLTGPARGYVKKRLTQQGVPFTHVFAPDFGDVAKAYRCLDLYLVTSREEGGPMAIMESMASGVPLVTTRVGMAPDIVVHGTNGCLVDVGDVDGIVRGAEEILGSPQVAEALVRKGLETGERFGYETIAKAYQELYGRLLAG